jgi:hypothetical protein
MERFFLPRPFFLGLGISLALIALAAPAAVSIEHDDQLDWYDWQEQRGYNPERDEILDIGEWNRRELERHWPEVDYSYYEWDEDWYYEDE